MRWGVRYFEVDVPADQGCEAIGFWGKAQDGVSLGWALIDLRRYEEARPEFEYVLKAAPDNLAAVRELSEIQQRRAAPGDAGTEQRRPAAASEANTEQRRPAAASEAGTEQRMRASQPDPPPAAAPVAAEEPPPPVDLVLAELEAWLAVITEERGARAAGV